jgi:lipoprotein-anchoring transpeptidase ErfK/SrfK
MRPVVVFAAGLLASALLASSAQAMQDVSIFSYPPKDPAQEDEQPQAAPIPREVVDYDGAYSPGTIVVDTAGRRLYYILPDHQAVRYGIGVGRPGFEWSGVHHIEAKREWPDWTPPAEMLKRRPDLPLHMAGGIDNPLGARAMYISGTMYRIHGSNEPDTIGQAVSSGCIRMTNEDVEDLYSRVRVGATVIVLPD